MSKKNKRKSETKDFPKKNDQLVSETMTKKEALAYFGLSKDATPFMLEEKYFQNIKRYRMDSEKFQEELDRINEIYRIASGKEVTIKSANTHEIPKKRKVSPYRIVNHLYYSWFKYLVAAIVLIVIFFFVRQVFFTPRVDFYIIGLGHFQRTNDVMIDYAQDELGYQRVYLGVADMIVDGSEAGDAYTAQGSVVATAFLQTGADVIISDETTMPFFWEYIEPIDELYDEIIESLPPERAQNIIPIYYSYAEYVTLVSGSYGFEDEEETDEIVEEMTLLPEHYDQHIFGIMIDDPELINALGIVNRWEEKETTLVFCVSSIASEPEGAEAFVRQILLEDPEMIKEALND